MIEARHYFFSGRVQGVFFRAQAQRAARRLGVAGWVKNLADGRVEAHAEGAQTTLEEFEREVSESLRGVSVEAVEKAEAIPLGLSDFEIRY